MKQSPSKSLEFWFHLWIGLLTIGITIGMALFIGSQVEKNMFPWWAYPALAIYFLAILFLDDALFGTDKSEHKE